MVREDDMGDVAGWVARHVACRAIIAIGNARRLRGTASGGLVARQTFAAKVGSLLICGGHGMGIVAGAAPQLLPTRSLAGTLGKVLGVACHRHLRCRTGAYEDRQRVREPFARAKCEVVFAQLRDADFAGKMALLADTIPL